MKILMVGGPGLYAFSLCEGLARAGAAPILLTIEGATSLISHAEGVEVRPVFHGDDSYPTTLRHLAGAIRDLAPDVVHFQWTFAPRRDWLVYRLARRWLPPTLFTVHNPLPHESASGERWALTQLYRSLPKIVVLAEAVRRELQEQFGVLDDRVAVIPHGNFDFYLDRFGEPSRDEARARLGLPTGAPVALFFGGWKRYKGLDVLIEAFETVKARLPEARLVLAGHAADAALVDAVREALDRPALRGAVRCDAGYVPLEDVRWYFAAADVVALPYRSGTYSGVVHVAYSFSRAVVTTNVGAVGKTVRQDGTGIVVPPEDSPALAEALVALLADRDRAAAMGAHGRELGRSRYSWDAIARQHLSLYQAAAR